MLVTKPNKGNMIRVWPHNQYCLNITKEGLSYFYADILVTGHTLGSVSWHHINLRLSANMSPPHTHFLFTHIEGRKRVHLGSEIEKCRDYYEQLYTNKLGPFMKHKLETYNLLRLNYERIENLNRLITSKEIESLIKNQLSE